jgi:hypothetical protein
MIRFSPNHISNYEESDEEPIEVQGRTFADEPNEPSPKEIEEDDQPKTPEVEEERIAQPSTPIPPENGRIGSQKIFEDIHEQLVYDTIEEKLSNLIDIEPEGENEKKGNVVSKILFSKSVKKKRQHTPENLPTLFSLRRQRGCQTL